MDFTGDQVSTPPVEEEVVETAQQEPDQVEAVEAKPAEDLLAKVNGLESAIGREREERRILQAKAEFLEQMAFQKGVANSEPEYDADDFPTFQAVDKLVEKKVSAIQEGMRQQQIISMEEQTKAKYSDFEDVVSTYTKELVNGNPDLYNVIMNSKNPAETAYQFGRSHPKYLEKIQQSTATKIAKKIDNNVNSTPTLSALGGVSNDRVSAGYYQSLSKQDFDKLVNDVMMKP